MIPRVFLVEPPRADVDVSPAERYGTILTLFGPVRRGPGSVGASLPRPRPSVIEAEPFSRALLERLREEEYDPDLDYFCLTGGTLQCCLGLAAIVAEHGRCKLLVFSAITGGYAAKEWRSSEVATKGDTRCTTGRERASTF